MCKTCNGRGILPDYFSGHLEHQCPDCDDHSDEACPTCKGEGWFLQPCPHCEPDTQLECVLCGGSGILDRDCVTCNGQRNLDSRNAIQDDSQYYIDRLDRQIRHPEERIHA